MAYQYFDENGNEVGDEGSFQSTTAEFPESFVISPLDASLVYYDYSGYSINNSSGQGHLPDNFEVSEQPGANDFQITLNNNETFYKYDEVSQTFTNSINAKLSGVDQFSGHDYTENWIYQFNLPTLSEVNLSILNNDDILGQTYLYAIGGYGIADNNAPPSGVTDENKEFAFDGILEKGEYVLRISPFYDDFKGSGSKYGLTTNFDLDVEFTPVTIGPDQGGDAFNNNYVNLGKFGNADTIVKNEYVYDHQTSSGLGPNRDVSDGYSFTIEGNQELNISIEGLKSGYWEIRDTDTQVFERLKNGEYSFNLDSGQYHLNVVIPISGAYTN